MRTATGMFLLVLGLATAGESTFDATRRVKDLAALVEEETFALARVDVARVDTDGLLQALSLLLPSRKEEIEEIRPRVQAFRAAFLRAGGRELVVSFSTADSPPVSFVQVPLKAGADVAGLTKLLTEHLAPWGVAEKRGAALVAGPRPVLARLAAGTPSARVELPDAVTAAGDTAVQVLLLPTNDQRRILDEVGMLPELGGSGKALTRGARWAALGINVGAKPSAKLTLHSAAAASAKRLAELLVANLERAGKRTFVGQDKALKDLFPKAFAASAKALTPVVTGHVVTVQVGEVEAFQALAVLANAIDQEGDGVERSSEGAKLREIIVGLHNHHDTFGTFPAHASYSKAGKPLLGWRVAILPFVGESELYKQFKLDEPWDSEHNKKLIAKVPKVYRSRLIRDARPGLTTFIAPVHAECAFTGGGAGLKLADFLDGSSNTVIVVDASDGAGVPWTKPADFMIDKKDPWKGLLGHYPDVVLVGMADGSVRRIPKTVPAGTLWAVFTRAGGEVIPDLSK